MDTIIMNSKNSKASEPHRLLLDHTDIINLERSDNTLLYKINVSLYYTWKNKKSPKNKLKISALTWNKKLELPDR